MFLNEHQSKKLFAAAGIAVPAGDCLGPEDVDAYAPPFPGPWYVKAQVLTGGRGKAGGVLRADTLDALRATARTILGMTIKGHAVPFVRVEPATDIRKECYLSFMLSRQRREMLLTTSHRGGMEVEATADARKPLVQRVPLDAGLREHHLRAAFFELGADPAGWAGFRDLAERLFRAVRDDGLLLAEINPLVFTGAGQWVALDGKVELDDNVVDLRPDLQGYYTPEHQGAEENAARDAGLSYVGLFGWVGLLVNGAGLAMATMDLLNFSGLPAANFMDLGGAADGARMRRALDLLFVNPKVRAVFINLFGGIVSCAGVARALMEALGTERAAQPVVVRMAGHESAEGRELLRAFAHPDVIIADEVADALDALRGIDAANRAREGADAAPPAAFPLADEAWPLPAAARKGYRRSGRRGVPWLGPDTQVLVQGITGKVAQRHVQLMQEYGTRIVAGVTPFKGGQSVLGVPVYDSVHEACRHHRIDASIIFVPAPFAPDAVMEAAAEEIPWAVCITEGIPQRAMLSALKNVPPSPTRVIGPNTPGIIVPGATKIGIMPGYVFTPGPVAIFSRSGTLTYEAAARLSAAGIGQSFCAGVGGDSFIGSDFISLFECIRDDDATEAVLVLGEVGGTAEEDLARWVTATGFAKPVLGFIAARTAPPGRRMGHAGAILDEATGGVDGKLQAMRDAGFAVCPDLASLPERVARALGRDAD